MFRFDADKPVRFCDGFTRRDFLHAGSLGLFGFGLNHFLSLKAEGAVPEDKDLNIIQLFLVGGPSQLDTWDMKPDAPLEIRGPYKPIKTNVPGIEISEIFPRMAQHADKYALVRSLYHTAAAVHDIGHQIMQTGRLFQGGVVSPHFGCVMGYKKGRPGRSSAARAVAEADREHGRWLAARSGRGFPGQDFRPLRSQCRSVGPQLQSAGHVAARAPGGDANRSKAGLARRC